MDNGVNDNIRFLHSIVSLAGAFLYPLSLSMLLPVFMYTLVFEKE